MDLFGLTITRTKQAPGQLQSVESRGGWWPLVRESYAGAWQQNVTIELANVLTYSTVFACVSLIASDIAKMRLRLVRLVSQDQDDIWEETESAAFSPVLRKPNRYQTTMGFIEQWVLSKLIHGNTYVLKQRDQRSLVVALYVLDPQRVRPLVAPDGSVYYELKQDDLSNQVQPQVVVPASEIIHDVMVPLYHPLVGVSPIHACGLSAVQALKIQTNSANLFANNARPGGLLIAPGAISKEQAARLKADWQENFTGENYGNLAVLTHDLKYESLTMNAVDAQLIDQLKWTSESICSCYHVPPYMVGVGAVPSYNNVESWNTQYYTQCLQEKVEKIERLLDEGLGLAPHKVNGERLGTEFDIDYLLRMDSATMMETIRKGVGAGVMTPDEGRAKLNYGPVDGGDTPYLQQQYWPLRDLSTREVPSIPPTAPKPIAPPDQPPFDETKFLTALTQELEAYAA